MSGIKFTFLCANIVFIVFNVILLVNKIQEDRQKQPNPEPPPRIQQPSAPNIEEYLFGYQSYENIISTLKEWEKQAPDLIEVGTFGKTSNDIDQYYLRIGNEYSLADEKVLITACIHGNEPLSTSTVMAYAGKLLASYGKDSELTKLVNSRTIYIVPVVSPDSYPSSRHVDKVDPNRNFPTLTDPEKISVKPIKNLQDFFLTIKPNSVLSGHTYGRIFLIPWGDSTKINPNSEDYERIAKEMANLTGYKYQRACQMYNKPIFGTEIDWYHRHGAFAMVMEFGSHQRKPSLEDTTSEFNKTFEGVVYFIKESVKVEIKQ